MDKFLGRTLEGRYLVEELIGVGGMANVYRGFDRVEQRAVAIKILRDEYSQNDEFLRRFRDESRAIYSLNHPNIVKIYDAILDSRNPTIVMEYVSGITVRDYIDRKQLVGIRVAVTLTMQLLRALQHAHDNGIVHRDIKPQNIMVPGDGSIKVMDFGIARFAMSQSRTITSTAIGSVHYTSPEQARGDTAIDHRSDIYSAGIILYEMLTGQLPFEGETPVAVAIKQIEQLPTPPSLLNSNIPHGLEEIVLRAIAKDPDDRYQSASEMIYDIERFVDNPSIVFDYRQKNPLPSSGKVRSNVYGEVKEMSEAKGRSDNEQAPPRKRKRKGISFLSVLFGITVAFVVCTASLIGYMLYNNNPFEAVPEVAMPSLTGLKYDEVIKDKKYRDFKFVLVEQEYNAKYAQGEIYEQYPTSGKMVKEGITVKLKVSNGNQVVTLPEFTGEEATLVLAKLHEMGLVGEQQLVNSGNISEGNVVSTEPAANQTVAVGSTVIVSVSRGSGKEKVQVPDVRGQDVETARMIIEEKGLVVGTITRKLSDLTPGTVLVQSPNYPAAMDVEGKINLTIAADAEDIANTTQQPGKAATILCLLPLDNTQQMKLTVAQDGTEILSQNIVPSERRVVSINVPGETGTSTITVRLDDKVFMEYLVTFDDEQASYTATTDNSAQFAGAAQ